MAFSSFLLSPNNRATARYTIFVKEEALHQDHSKGLLVNAQGNTYLKTFLAAQDPPSYYFVIITQSFLEPSLMANLLFHHASF